MTTPSQESGDTLHPQEQGGWPSQFRPDHADTYLSARLMAKQLAHAERHCASIKRPRIKRIARQLKQYRAHGDPFLLKSWLNDWGATVDAECAMHSGDAFQAPAFVLRTEPQASRPSRLQSVSQGERP